MPTVNKDLAEKLLHDENEPDLKKKKKQKHIEENKVIS